MPNAAAPDHTSVAAPTRPDAEPEPLPAKDTRTESTLLTEPTEVVNAKPDPDTQRLPDVADDASPTKYQPTPSLLKLQRADSLSGMAIPSAPALIATEGELPPLGQLLLDAPDMASAEKQRRELAPMGLKIVSRKNLPGLGLVLSTFRLPDDADSDGVLAAVKALFPQATAELNQRYRLLFSKNQSYAQKLVGVQTPSRCRQTVALAMLDSAVNTQLSFLPGERVKSIDVTNRETLSAKHGTGVATIMVADDQAYPSLLPNGQLTAVNVFALDEKGDPETRTDWLLYGLNALTSIQPMPLAVNLSFGGNDSPLLKNAINRLSAMTTFIAAAGNDGSDKLVYPAAYQSVYAVGGVDAKGRKTSGSNYGKHLAIMAPGEDIWTSDDSGNGYYATGTSFAAPFATVAIALAKNAGLSVDDFVASLGESRLVNLAGLCP
ncbi:MAG: S8 family serine peptidase [Hahellaceae bacterium]|nr:S8 family serine peptidase [Hahellaceae bacterium]